MWDVCVIMERDTASHLSSLDIKMTVGFISTTDSFSCGTEGSEVEAGVLLVDLFFFSFF